MKYRAGIIICFLFFINGCPSLAQSIYKYFYRVYFTDKGANNPNAYSAADLFSQRAVDRRQKSGIGAPDYRDLPVNSEYIGQVTSRGFRLHCTSRWMNTALFKTKIEGNIAAIEALPFVSAVKLVYNGYVKGPSSDKLEVIASGADIPAYDRQIIMLNGYPLHNSGYNGTGILIAVLDGGFTNTDKASSLAALRSRKGIKYTYDFVNRNSYVYDYHTHGTAVLSVLAGQIPGAINGTAPGADFVLLRTEDGASEFPVEEDFWAAGAEFADSAGADIISSSLGYCTFDDNLMSYKFSELDGNTAFITRAADIAASKGILVVNSAGNERNKTWKRIVAPSDGDSVLAAGAVDANNMISSFSSAGPSADGQVKPDNSALGVSIVVQTGETELIRSNGTSFSCPVLSGMAACLLEAVTGASSIELINAMHSSSDKYFSPDSLYGYGIPDMVKALKALQDIHLTVPDDGSAVGPNPTYGDIELTFTEEPGSIVAEIVNSSGKIIYKKDFGEYAGRYLRLTALNNREQGIYFIRLITDRGPYRYKIIKLNDR